MGEGKLRYLLKKGEGGKPRETVLQEKIEIIQTDENDDIYVENVWVDVPLVVYEDS